jgi:heptosyltransferase-1
LSHGWRVADRATVNRVLIVKLGAPGDIVHAIPVAAALRRTFPSVHIDWLVSAKHREILDLVPAIDRRLVINDRGAGGGAGVLATIRELRRGRYDVALDLQGLVKSAIFARGSGAARVIGFASRYVSRWRGRSTPRCTIRRRRRTHPDGRTSCGQTRHARRSGFASTHRVSDRSVGRRPPGRRTADGGVPRSTRRRVADQRVGAVAPDRRAPRSGQHSLPSIVVWGPVSRSPRGYRGIRRATICRPHIRRRSRRDLARHAALFVSGTRAAHIAAAVGTRLSGSMAPSPGTQRAVVART